MSDLISRDETLKVLRGKAIAKYPNSFSYGLFAAANEILDIPAVDAVPVVHGRWVKYGHYPPECSVCGGIAPKDCEGEEFYQSDFCQSCGAKMYEGKDNG